VLQFSTIKSSKNKIINLRVVTMADIFENKLFLVLIVIIQPVVFFFSLEYLGYFGALVIPWSILILYIIWNRKVLKAALLNHEEE